MQRTPEDDLDMAKDHALQRFAWLQLRATQIKAGRPVDNIDAKVAELDTLIQGAINV